MDHITDKLDNLDRKMDNLERKVETLEQGLNQKMDLILSLLDKKKTARGRDTVVSSALKTERNTELLKLFWNMVALSLDQKQVQSFPKEIRQLPDQVKPDGSVVRSRVPEIVPYSVLKNRCGLRKAFRPGDGELHTGEVFDEAVKNCDQLVVRTLSELGLRTGSDVRVVLSVGELREDVNVVKEPEKKEKPKGFGPQGKIWDPALGEWVDAKPVVSENVVVENKVEDWSNREEEPLIEEAGIMTTTLDDKSEDEDEEVAL